METIYRVIGVIVVWYTIIGGAIILTGASLLYVFDLLLALDDADGLSMDPIYEKMVEHRLRLHEYYILAQVMRYKDPRLVARMIGFTMLWIFDLFAEEVKVLFR